MTIVFLIFALIALARDSVGWAFVFAFLAVFT